MALSIMHAPWTGKISTSSTTIWESRDPESVALALNVFCRRRVISKSAPSSASRRRGLTWLQIRNMGDGYHKTAAPAPNDLLFPTEVGTPYRVGNYLKRILKPIAEKAGVPDLTFQSLRRTFATHFQRYGSPKDAQAQLRHSKLEMTCWYMKQIPEAVRAAAEKMDADLCRVAENPKTETGESIQRSFCGGVWGVVSGVLTTSY